MTLSSSAQAIQSPPATPSPRSQTGQSKAETPAEVPLDDIVDLLEWKDPAFSVLRDVDSEKLKSWAGRVTGNSEKDRSLENEIARDLSQLLSQKLAPGEQKPASQPWDLKEGLMNLAVAAIPTGMTAFACAIPALGPATSVGFISSLAYKLVEGSSLPQPVKTAAAVGIVGAALPAMGFAALASTVPGLTLPICALSAGLSALTLGGFVAADKAGLIEEKSPYPLGE